MGYISRNKACVMIGEAFYGEPRSLSGAKLGELIDQGKIIQKSLPSMGGKLNRHFIDEESVREYIVQIKKDMRNPKEDANERTPVGSGT